MSSASAIVIDGTAAPFLKMRSHTSRSRAWFLRIQDSNAAWVRKVLMFRDSRMTEAVVKASPREARFRVDGFQVKPARSARRPATLQYTSVKAKSTAAERPTAGHRAQDRDEARVRKSAGHAAG